eukprot:TRINITY_DN2567_c0_g1_i3.p1 TRINITY_DN2567_c0_g1~~TRINITY_DN2567_c0_g1_i3.p1  ORF type:complete len:417 (-),score=88.01 TRINITY_DN2567_c0_g1_i3:129-1379(-)
MACLQGCHYRSSFLSSASIDCFRGKQSSIAKLSSDANFSTKQGQFAVKNFLKKANCGIKVPFTSKDFFVHPKHAFSSNPALRASIVKASADMDVEAGNTDETEKEKSEVYSSNMSKAMGAVLTYRHELGMNYNFVLPNLIVGSCPQNPADVDKLKDIGVRTIFCLQQDPDLAYFDVDISAIQEHAKQIDGIQHIRAEIRDFDAFDMRMRLPKVVSKLLDAVKGTQGITYIHCTAGLGRAPSVALAFMFWVLGYKLEDAHKLLQSVRPCFPKLDAIRSATADMLTNGDKHLVTLEWRSGTYSSVQLCGLDVGWGQKIPLSYNAQRGSWILERELPVGHYEYKYIVDGIWTCNEDELTTSPNIDGNVNNYIEVRGDEKDMILRKRLQQEDNLTEEERRLIRAKLEEFAIEDYHNESFL